MERVMTKMLAKVSRAICSSMGYEPDGFDAELLPENESPDGWRNWMAFQSEARSAVRTLHDHTLEMVVAGDAALRRHLGDQEIERDLGLTAAIACFDAMVRAALSPEGH